MRIGIIIRKWRVISELDVRQVAKEIGISDGTLTRIEQGKATDSETLAKVLNWAMQQPEPNPIELLIPSAGPLESNALTQENGR